MPAGRWDFTLEQGSTFDKTIKWESDGTVVDITGYTIRLGLKHDVSRTAYIYTASTGAGEFTITDGTSGICTLTITGTAIAALDFNKAVHNIEYLSAGNVPKRLLEGVVTLSREVIS